MSSKLSTVITLQHQLDLGNLADQLAQLSTSDVSTLIKRVLDVRNDDSVDHAVAEHLAERIQQTEEQFLSPSDLPAYNPATDPDHKYYGFNIVTKKTA